MEYSVLIPVYNEETAIVETVDLVQKVMQRVGKTYEIICINDGSRDKSAETLRSLSGIKVVTNPYNLGYGASLKKGLMHAKGKYIIITDADGTYPIDRIPNLVAHLPHFDMVVGARNQKNVPMLRKPAKAILRTLAAILTGRKIPDLNSGLRVFRRDMALEFMHLYPPGFSFTSTITLASMTNGYAVRYVPIPYYKRKGSSSIKPIKDFIGFTLLLFRVMTYFDPLKFFLLPGLLLMILGVVYGIYQFVIIQNIAQLPIILILAGLQICFLGLIADLIVKKNKQR